MIPASEEDLPKATHEGTAKIFGIEVRTFRLDDGRAVIHADDFHKILQFMGITPADLEALLKTSGMR